MNEAWKADLEEIVDPNTEVFSKVADMITNLLQAKDIEWIEEMVYDYEETVKEVFETRGKALLNRRLRELRKIRDEYWEKNKVEVPEDDDESEDETTMDA